MGLEDIFRKILKEAHKEDISGKEKEIEGARQLEDDYRDLANNHGLDYWEGSGYFLVLANKRLSEDADHRKKNTPPWPGIKIHSPLSAEMYKVLKSDEFKEMLENGEIDGIKVYLYSDDNVKHKEVTIYISPYSMPNLGKFLDILESILKNDGIHIQPALSSYYDQGYEMVLLNRMPIAPDAGIFARYSTDFTGKMNIDDYIMDMYRSKIDDHVWRVAADNESNPQIVAVSRSWLLNNQDNLDEILRDSSTIYTLITLKPISRETIAPDLNIILSYDKHNKQIEAYDVLNARIVKYDLSNWDDLEKISDHPKERLEKFLKNGTANPQQNNIF
jgi:hypothetical protein